MDPLEVADDDVHPGGTLGISDATKLVRMGKAKSGWMTRRGKCKKCDRVGGVGN